MDFLILLNNAAMQIILNPSVDIILTKNLFGDIISDEADVIGGSISLLSSASVGDEIFDVQAVMVLIHKQQENC